MEGSIPAPAKGLPATPNSKLANKIREFVNMEIKKIKMSTKIVKTEVISIRDKTVSLDRLHLSQMLDKRV